MDSLLDPIRFVSHSGHEIEVTGLLNESYVTCRVNGEPTSRPYNTLPRLVREKLDAKTNGRRTTMATATKKQGKTQDAPVVETEAEKEARRAEREAARQAKLEEQLQAIAARIVEGVEIEVEGEKFRAALRKDLDDLKPTAELAAMLKKSHGLSYGRLEGRGAWRIPVK